MAPADDQAQVYLGRHSLDGSAVLAVVPKHMSERTYVVNIRLERTDPSSWLGHAEETRAELSSLSAPYGFFPMESPIMISPGMPFEKALEGAAGLSKALLEAGFEILDVRVWGGRD